MINDAFEKPQNELMSNTAPLSMGTHGILVFHLHYPLFLLFALRLAPDGASLLFSTDEESPFLLYILKEGKDKLILITSDGDFGLWFVGWKMSDIFLPCRQDGCCLHIDEYTPLCQLIRFPSLLSFLLYNSLFFPATNLSPEDMKT